VANSWSCLRKREGRNASPPSPTPLWSVPDKLERRKKRRGQQLNVSLARALWNYMQRAGVGAISLHNSAAREQQAGEHTGRRRKAAPEEVNKANININAIAARSTKQGFTSAVQNKHLFMIYSVARLHLLALTLLLRCARLTVYSIAEPSRRPLHLLLRFLLDCNLVCSQPTTQTCLAFCFGFLSLE
jgi:hypothetical protein